MELEFLITAYVVALHRIYSNYSSTEIACGGERSMHVAKRPSVICLCFLAYNS